MSGSKQWRPLYDSPEPHKMQLPHGLHLLPAFKKLLILRCIRYHQLHILPASHMNHTGGDHMSHHNTSQHDRHRHHETLQKEHVESSCSKP